MAKRLSTVLKHMGKPNKDANYSIYCANMETIKHFIACTTSYKSNMADDTYHNVTPVILLGDIINKIDKSCKNIWEVEEVLQQYKLTYNEEQYIKSIVNAWYIDTN